MIDMTNSAFNIAFWSAVLTLIGLAQDRAYLKTIQDVTKSLFFGVSHPRNTLVHAGIRWEMLENAGDVCAKLGLDLQISLFIDNCSGCKDQISQSVKKYLSFFIPSDLLANEIDLNSTYGFVRRPNAFSPFDRLPFMSNYTRCKDLASS